ncbi:hypothetical protein AMTRI_Chr02g220020 [Amborella trichopoda]
MGGGFGPVVAMTVVQIAFTGLNVLCKMALDSGMNPFVMVTYRQFVATTVMAPLAFFFERNTKLKFNRKILFQICLCAFFGATMNQSFYFAGLKKTSPTLACALCNLLPALTFVLAVPFRMETVGLKTLAAHAKIWGTVMCVGGAMLMTFYKGVIVPLKSSGIHLKYSDSKSDNSIDAQEMILGSFFVVLSCLAWAIWFLIQAKMSKTFVAPYTTTAITSSMASIQCAVITSIVERDISAWALGWNIRLLVVLYTGVFGSGLAFALMNWSISRRGPLFVSMFGPLLLVMVGVIGILLFDEKLYLGSVLGSILIVAGLYSVLWGKGKEMNSKGIVPTNTSQEKVDNEGRIEGIVLPMFSTQMPDNQEQTIDCSEEESSKDPELSSMHSIDFSGGLRTDK